MRENIIEGDITPGSWRNYFDFADVYREHVEYDENGNPTGAYMKGDIFGIFLNDGYYYVDNSSRNQLEWNIFLEGSETKAMTNEGRVYDPEITEYAWWYDYYGADAFIVLKDFINVWDEGTNERYGGEVLSYDVSNCSGHFKIISDEYLQYNHLKMISTIWQLTEAMMIL